jgi:hypothetical protein
MHLIKEKMTCFFENFRTLASLKSGEKKNRKIVCLLNAFYLLMSNIFIIHTPALRTQARKLHNSVEYTIFVYPNFIKINCFFHLPCSSLFGGTGIFCLIIFNS